MRKEDQEEGSEEEGSEEEEEVILQDWNLELEVDPVPAKKKKCSKPKKAEDSCWGKEIRADRSR
ncbi:MAG: hypothetical protein AB1793_00530 [Candidatus Thermoplasmatota archaeon]